MSGPKTKILTLKLNGLITKMGGKKLQAENNTRINPESERSSRKIEIRYSGRPNIDSCEKSVLTKNHVVWYKYEFLNVRRFFHLKTDAKYCLWTVLGSTVRLIGFTFRDKNMWICLGLKILWIIHSEIFRKSKYDRWWCTIVYIIQYEHSVTLGPRNA